MKPLQNDRFIRALLRKPVDVTPVWMMRQAGRYLPEYRKIRKQAGSFMDLCTNPELACEVTLQPIERFPLDAAILFSDILTIPDAMGLGLHFEEGEGPLFSKPIRTPADVKALSAPDPEDELRYVMDAVRLIRKELDNRVPLIGFSGSPWTLSTYMVEGRSSKTYSRVKGMLYNEPALMHQMLNTLAESVIAYLNAQIAAGVQAVMIFDTWGGILTPVDYAEFSLRYMEKIVAGQFTLRAVGMWPPSYSPSERASTSWIAGMSYGSSPSCESTQSPVTRSSSLMPTIVYSVDSVIGGSVSSAPCAATQAANPPSR